MTNIGRVVFLGYLSLEKPLLAFFITKNIFFFLYLSTYIKLHFFFLHTKGYSTNHVILVQRFCTAPR